MAGERTLPGLGLTGYWDLGSGWKPGMDTNLRTVSVVTQMIVKSRVAALPGSPTNGDIHILTATADVNKIAARDNGAWVLLSPREGWIAYDEDTSTFIKFTGTEWDNLLSAASELPSMAGQEGKVLAVDTGEASTIWVSAATYPAFTGNGGKVLTVNDEETNAGWATPVRLPDLAGNDGNVLTVVAGETAWVPPGGLPDFEDNGLRVLAVKSDESGAEWVDRGRLVIVSKTADYELALTDAGAYIRMNSPTGINLTVPASGTVDFPVGTTITVRNTGAGQVTIVAAGGVSITSPETLKLRKQHSSASLTLVAANTWELVGDLELL